MCSYVFICLFRADISASGLAFRMVRLWEYLANTNKEVYLVVNASLYEKILDNKKINEENIFIIPEALGFKLSMFLFVPFIILYLLLVKKCRKFHLSVGGAYFINYLKKISSLIPGGVTLHTSIGSKSLEAITGGNLSSKYYKLHKNLINYSHKIDCLYSPEGFGDLGYKFIQSPGSFSWKFCTEDLLNVNLSVKKKDILFCSSLIPQKNYRLAIDSYIMFCQQNTILLEKPTLFIVAPEVTNVLREEIIRFNSLNIGLIEFVNYKFLNEKLKEAFVFLSLQDYDNYPSQSLIEAMAFGCTIIATNYGETGKMVLEENGNKLIDKNKENLVKEFNKYFSNPSFINEKNRTLILKMHTIEAYAEYFHKNFIAC